MTWAQLEALGIDDGPSSHVITLRVTSGAQTVTDTAMLQITNVAPSTGVSYLVDVRVGVPSTFEMLVTDPSSADLAAPFTFVVDWGDGSELQTLSGPSETSVEHTFTAPGTYTAFFGATDKDGGTQEPNGVEIEVTGSATTTTTTAPPSTTTTTEPPTSTTTSSSTVVDHLVVHVARLHLDAGDERLGPAGVDRVERRADRVPRGPAAGLWRPPCWRSPGGRAQPARR